MSNKENKHTSTTSPSNSPQKRKKPSQRKKHSLRRYTSTNEVFFNQEKQKIIDFLNKQKIQIEEEIKEIKHLPAGYILDFSNDTRFSLQNPREVAAAKQEVENNRSALKIIIPGGLSLGSAAWAGSGPAYAIVVNSDNPYIEALVSAGNLLQQLIIAGASFRINFDLNKKWNLAFALETIKKFANEIKPLRLGSILPTIWLLYTSSASLLIGIANGSLAATAFVEQSAIFGCLLFFTASVSAATQRFLGGQNFYRNRIKPSLEFIYNLLQKNKPQQNLSIIISESSQIKQEPTTPPTPLIDEKIENPPSPTNLISPTTEPSVASFVEEKKEEELDSNNIVPIESDGDTISNKCRQGLIKVTDWSLIVGTTLFGQLPLATMYTLNAIIGFGQVEVFFGGSPICPNSNQPGEVCATISSNTFFTFLAACILNNIFFSNSLRTGETIILGAEKRIEQTTLQIIINSLEHQLYQLDADTSKWKKNIEKIWHFLTNQLGKYPRLLWAGSGASIVTIITLNGVKNSMIKMLDHQGLYHLWPWYSDLATNSAIIRNLMIVFSCSVIYLVNITPYSENEITKSRTKILQLEESIKKLRYQVADTMKINNEQPALYTDIDKRGSIQSEDYEMKRRCNNPCNTFLSFCMKVWACCTRTNNLANSHGIDEENGQEEKYELEQSARRCPCPSLSSLFSFRSTTNPELITPLSTDDSLTVRV